MWCVRVGDALSRGSVKVNLHCEAALSEMTNVFMKAHSANSLQNKHSKQAAKGILESGGCQSVRQWQMVETGQVCAKDSRT